MNAATGSLFRKRMVEVFGVTAIVLGGASCSGDDSDIDQSSIGDTGDAVSGDAVSGDAVSGDAVSGDAVSDVVGSDDSGGSGVTLTGTAALIRDALEEQSARLPAYQDAAIRLVAALEGGEADGVTVGVSGNSRNCTVLADLDGDGQRETSISVAITYETPAMEADEPIRLSVSLGLPGEPLVSVSARLTPIGDSKLEVSEAAAQLETPKVSVYGSEGQGVLDPAASAGADLVAMKYTSFDKDYIDRVDGRFTLELTADGYRLRVVVDDDPETPEDETTEFFVDGKIVL